MDFQTAKPEETYWLDKDAGDGIIFYGPDTEEWLRTMIEVSRVAAKTKAMTEKDDTAIEFERRKLYRSAVSLAVKGFTESITLDGKKPTKPKYIDIINCLDINVILSIIEWLQSRESFLGKP